MWRVVMALWYLLGVAAAAGAQQTGPEPLPTASAAEVIPLGIRGATYSGSVGLSTGPQIGATSLKLKFGSVDGPVLPLTAEYQSRNRQCSGAFPGTAEMSERGRLQIKVDRSVRSDVTASACGGTLQYSFAV